MDEAQTVASSWEKVFRTMAASLCGVAIAILAPSQRSTSPPAPGPPSGVPADLDRTLLILASKLQSPSQSLLVIARKPIRSPLASSRTCLKPVCHRRKPHSNALERERSASLQPACVVLLDSAGTPAASTPHPPTLPPSTLPPHPHTPHPTRQPPTPGGAALRRGMPALSILIGRRRPWDGWSCGVGEGFSE